MLKEHDELRRTEYRQLSIYGKLDHAVAAGAGAPERGLAGELAHVGAGAVGLLVHAGGVLDGVGSDVVGASARPRVDRLRDALRVAL